MVTTVFNALIYQPLYNGLVFLVGLLPSHDVGLAVIVLTIIVRILLWPLSGRAIETQVKMKKLTPQMEALKEKYKNDREQQSKAMFALYRENDVHPFASTGLLLVQLPILFALYWVFAGGGLPSIHAELLYPFVQPPAAAGMLFLGLLDMKGHSIVLGLLAALAQFAYTRLTMGPRTPAPKKENSSFTDDLTRTFELQARYVLPATFVLLSFVIPNAAMLYIVTSNTFMVGQELASGRRF